MTDTSPTEYSYITPSAFGLTMDLVDKHPVQSPLVFLPGVFGLGVFGVQAMTLLMQMGAETEPVPPAFLFLGMAALLINYMKKVP